MKYITLTLILSWIGLNLLFSQEKCELFYNLHDFKTNRASQSFSYSHSNKMPVRFSNFWMSPYLYIKGNPNGKILLDSIYAVRLGSGITYRIIKRKAFLIADTGYLTIYRQKEWATISQPYARGVRHTRKPVTNFYFSCNDSAPIIPLTLQTLSHALCLPEDIKTILTQQSGNELTFVNRHFQINNLLIPNYKPLQ